MRMLVVGMLVVFCAGTVLADRTSAAVQWPGWVIEADEDVISTRYPLSNFADGHPETAWVFEKTVINKEGYRPTFNHGVGRRIRIDTEQKLTFNGLTMLNGYCKDAATYRRNNRIRKITVTIFDGKQHAYTFPLRATLAPQRCAFPAVTSDAITITIDQVDVGRDDDLCISELQLLSGDKPVNWHLTPFVVTNDTNLTCCGGITLQLSTQGGLRLPGPDGKPLGFLAAALQPGTHALLLASVTHLYLFDMDRGTYLHHRVLPGGELVNDWGSLGWLDAHTAVVGVAPESSQCQYTTWYTLRVNGRYTWTRTGWTAKTRPKLLPGYRGPYYGA